MANEDPQKKLRDAANAYAGLNDVDLLIFNFEVMPPYDLAFIGMISKRERRKNVVIFITTEGGSADSAFRIMRCLQAHYNHVTVVVGGWCKSAGTLMCIGAHQLYIGDLGELGPLDVQIVKADEMDEQKSGLVAEAAFEKLQEEAYKFFMEFVRDIGRSEYRVTLRTAAELATNLTIGVMSSIFSKLDPVTIGEDYRSNKLAMSYAERLDIQSKNLKRTTQFDALDNLLSAYPSHGFVIDLMEARSLFKKVDRIPDGLVPIMRLLGTDVLRPRNNRQGFSARLEFMNDDKQSTEDKAVRGPRSRNRAAGNGKRSSDVSRNSQKRGSAKPRARALGTNQTQPPV